MNKRGSFFLGFVVFLIVFINGVLFIPFIQDDITTTRIDLNCSDSTISSGNMITCLMVDSAIPYFIVLFISVALGFIAGKII